MVRKNSSVGLSVYELKSRNSISAKLLEFLITLTTQKDLIDKQIQNGMECRRDRKNCGIRGKGVFQPSPLLQHLVCQC